MFSIACIDGRLLEPSEAKVSVYDRGFLYGDSVFETMATRGGKIVDLSRHLSRLASSANDVGIPLPVTAEALAAEIRKTVAASGEGERAIRVMLTRGVGEWGLMPEEEGRATRVLLVQELHRPSEEAYRTGIAAVTWQVQRPGDGTEASAAKIGNYLVAILAARRAAVQGAAETLLLDPRGRVLEGSTSNVFFVKEGVLMTPPTSAGILDGTVRRRVLELAAESGVTVVQRSAEAAELFAADEIFITSSIREVLAVVRLDGRTIGGGRPGKHSSALLEAYRLRAGTDWAE